MSGAGWTQGTKHEMSQIVKLSRNAEFVREYLLNGIRLRSFSETLMSAVNAVDKPALQARLVRELCRQPGAPERDSIRRKVSLWLADKALPDRNQLIRICFALGLSEIDAQNFMAAAGEGSLHSRNPEELAYLFALRNSLSYSDALALFTEIAPIISDEGGQGDSRAVAEGFVEVRGRAQFVEFVTRERMNFGNLHNTAYRYFMNYMSVLSAPESIIEGLDEKSYTVREIVETYLPAPSKPSKGEDDMLKKALRRHWPDETSISRIINRRADVPRRALVLLFIATDGAGTFERGAQRGGLSRKQAFVDRYRRLSLMLDDCGFSPLDPRGHFDWLALYCMCAAEDADTNARMKSVLAQIFAE